MFSGNCRHNIDCRFEIDDYFERGESNFVPSTAPLWTVIQYTFPTIFSKFVVLPLDVHGQGFEYFLRHYLKKKEKKTVN